MLASGITLLATGYCRNDLVMPRPANEPLAILPSLGNSLETAGEVICVTNIKYHFL